MPVSPQHSTSSPHRLGKTKIGPQIFHWGRQTYLMGILNVTPDSFSGDGLWSEGDTQDVIDRVLLYAADFVDSGVDILDVGGESTRPGSVPVPVEEEVRRVVPVVAALSTHFDVAISVDTSKSEVARRALDAGAHLVNDVWGLRADPQMAGIVAEYHVPVVVMHNRGRPQDVAQSQALGGRYTAVEYEDLLADVIEGLQTSIDIATEAGIPKQNIIVDPGIGFGKTVEQNLELIDRLLELWVLGHPLLVGPSRKSFIGYTLHVPPGERLFGTAAAVALCAARGADIVRIHDVREMGQVCRMVDAIVRNKGNSTE